MTKKIEKFTGIVKKKIYDSDNFKVYSLDVDKEKFPKVEFNKYGDVTIVGNLHDLVFEMPYDIVGEESQGKYGFCYKVKNIKAVRDGDGASVYAFLRGILTDDQADTLYRLYPNIIDLVISNKADEVVDLNQTKGIKQKTFAVIKRKIIENYVLFDLIAEFDGLLTVSVLKSIYDKYPSIEKIRELIKQDPYEFFTQLSRVGFKKADSMLLNMQKNGKLEFGYDLKTSKERCMSAMAYLLEENENEGNTRLRLKTLKQQIDNLVPECAKHFVDCLKDNRFYYDLDKMVVAIRSTYEIEVFIADRVKDAITKNMVWDFDIEKYRKTDEGDLTDEQMGILDNICKYNICMLIGQGGVGKSYTMSTAIKMLDDNHKSYRLMSPTGKAAQVLRDYTGRVATTIHIGLGYRPDGRWEYNKDNPIPTDVVIVDEFSMVDIYLFKILLSAIDFNRTKLLIVGDNAQLNSVGTGNCLHNLITSKKIPVTELTKIFRYSDGGLMKVATDIRYGKKYLDTVNNQITVLGKNKDYVFIQANNEASVKTVISLYKKLIDSSYSPKDIMVLAAYNKGEYGTVVINKELQKIVNPNYGSDVFMKIGDTTYYVGDIVLQTKNDYRVPIYGAEDITGIVCNGSTGVIKVIMHDSMIVEFEDTEYEYSRDMMNNLLLGYAMSIHKSQGSSSKIVIAITPSAHTYMLSSNLLYVALTRMKEKCFHIGDLKTVNRAIKKKVNLMRDTFLEELLEN